MSKQTARAGFSIVEVVIVFVVLAIVGLLGYVAYTNFLGNNSNDSSANSEESPVASDVESAPEIKSSSDLDAALTTLDETDVEESAANDEQRLDGELSAF